jgi:hypothetical protein
MLRINCHGMTSNTCILCTLMLASVHKMYLSHLTSSFFSLADKGSAFHMIHIIQLWGFDSANIIRIIGVIWIFMFVIQSGQQEFASLGLSVNVQAFISCNIDQTDCASIIKNTLANFLTLVSSPHACASVNWNVKLSVIYRSNHKVSHNNIKRKRQIFFVTPFLP